MTRVDFYILAAEDTTSRLDYAARLCHKALRHNMRVLVMSTEEDRAKLDALLWSFRLESFVAHTLFGQHNANDPVVLSCGEDDPARHDLLINLLPNIPEGFSRFERLAHIVIQQTDILSTCRTQYGYFKERGYPLYTHKQ